MILATQAGSAPPVVAVAELRLPLTGDDGGPVVRRALDPAIGALVGTVAPDVGVIALVPTP